MPVEPEPHRPDLKRVGWSEHLAHTSDRPVGWIIDRADGPFLYLRDGRRIVDLIAGIAVSALGHRHPVVIDAIRAQIDRHLHVMVYGEFEQEAQSGFAADLANCLPRELSTVYFTNSGAEAVEGALKTAKKATGRRKLIGFDRSYHGDTHGALSVTGRDIYKKPFEPLLPDVEILPFDDVTALDQIDSDTAAVITEPIQGEGGIRVPSPGWMKKLRERTLEAGALLIFDEIQTGMGRTGSLFAFEQMGVVPDLLCLAKALGGGMPLGAFISSREIMSVLKRDPPLSHVTTFGGHPVSCAAGRAALRVIKEEGLPARAFEIEARLRERLKHEGIVEVRGRGAMLGMELDSVERATRCVELSGRNGVLVGWTLHSNRLIRLAPPLNIPFDVLEEAVDVLLETLDSTHD